MLKDIYKRRAYIWDFTVFALQHLLSVGQRYSLKKPIMLDRPWQTSVNVPIHLILRDRPFLTPGTWAERLWLGHEKYLTIFDGARKIFDTILWGAK